ncbi:hypothetical protein YC2023_075983 [Brassica napus]
MRMRNRVEQVVTTGCTPEDKGYETTVINTCSRSRKSLPQLVEACLEKLVMGSSFDTREAVREYLRSITGMSRPGVSRSVNKYKAHHKEILKMKQSKKLLEDIAGIAENCPTVSPSQEGFKCKEKPIAFKGTKQVLIRLMAGSMTNRHVQVVDGDAHVLVFGDILIQEGRRVLLKCEEVMLKCNMFKNIKGKSKTVSEIWSMSDFKVMIGWQVLFRVAAAKEELNLQKDVQVSVQALEQVRDFDNKVVFKEDHEITSSLAQGGAERRFTYPGTERVYDLVNHIGGVFRYFIVDVVDPGSTPDVARCGRKLGEKFLSHEQRLNRMSSERDMDIMSLYSVTSGYHNLHK